MNLFQNHPMLLQILQLWVQQKLEQIFDNRGLEAAMVEDTIMAMLTKMPPAPLPPEEGLCLPRQPCKIRHGRAPRHFMRRCWWAPGSCPAAPAAIPTEREESQEEPGEAVPRPSTTSWGRERPRGATATPKEEHQQLRGLSSQQEASTTPGTLEGPSPDGRTRTGPPAAAHAGPQGLPDPISQIQETHANDRKSLSVTNSARWLCCPHPF